MIAPGTVLSEGFASRVPLPKPLIHLSPDLPSMLYPLLFTAAADWCFQLRRRPLTERIERHSES